MFAAHGVLLPALLSANAQTAYVATSEGTTSTSYTDLTTTTDTVTVTVGSSGMVLVLIQCALLSTAANVSVVQYVSYDISGANTKSASDDYAMNQWNYRPSSGIGFLETGLTAGVTTFKLKYRISSSSRTGTFARRGITVVPL